METTMLPDLINPKKLAQQGAYFDTRVSIAALGDDIPFLMPESEGNFDAQLQFSVDAQGLSLISAQIQGSCTLQCQRCLDYYSHSVNSSSLLSPVKDDDAAKKLPDAYESILLREGQLSLKVLLKEEILLSMPQIPKHFSCDSEEMPKIIVETNKRKPFADLKTWIDAKK